MRILVIGLLLATMLAGCNGPSEVEFEVPPVEDGKYVILMTPGFKFIPQNAQVPAGATILFRNEGGFHNVESETDAWPAGDVTDEDFEMNVPADMEGDFPYFCAPHKTVGMTGVIRVVPA